MLYTPPCETLAIAASQLYPEALAACMVLAHPRAMFHPCTCGLRGVAAAFAAALIGYDDRGDCCLYDHKEEAIVIDYFLSTDMRLRWNTALSLLRCSARLVVTMIYDPFTSKFPGCNGRYSASVAYLFPINHACHACQSMYLSAGARGMATTAWQQVH
jgi:hypothetical protein